MKSFFFIGKSYEKSIKKNKIHLSLVSMGCLKLDYYEDLQVRTGVLMLSGEAKVELCWLSVDPLAEKYAGRSPYEYCLGNPINFIDPTGMSSEEIYSPIFDKKTGEYLGTDKDGWHKGDVLLMDKSKFSELSKNGKMDHNTALKNSTSIANLPNTLEGVELFTKIADQVIKGMNKFYYSKDPSSNLQDGHIDVYSDESNIGTSNANVKGLGSDIGVNRNVFPDVDNITIGFDHRKMLSTAPNLFSLFEHEYAGHGLQKLRQKFGEPSPHPKVYKFQVNTPNFKYTTGEYKKHVLEKNKYWNPK